MCTCITYNNLGSFYFGRNLDLEYSFNERVVITPRNYCFHFHDGSSSFKHPSLIGMASVVSGYPLYAEAVNESGLCMAGLNFPGTAKYLGEKEGMYNVAPFEFIPWILTQCHTVKEAKEKLESTNLVAVNFSDQLPAAPLHWMISDENSSIVVEPMEDGLHIFDNPFGVMTNNPPFDYHLYNMNNYMHLSAENAVNRIDDSLPLKTYAEGMGALGLPGDSSSASRFVLASFLKAKASSENKEECNVAEFFRILNKVAMVKGSVVTGGGHHDITTYSCCINVNTGVYYYITYDNLNIEAVDMHHEDLEGDEVISYPLVETMVIHKQN